MKDNVIHKISHIRNKIKIYKIIEDEFKDKMILFINTNRREITIIISNVFNYLFFIYLQSRALKRLYVLKLLLEVVHEIL